MFLQRWRKTSCKKSLAKGKVLETECLQDRIPTSNVAEGSNDLLQRLARLDHQRIYGANFATGHFLQRSQWEARISEAITTLLWTCPRFGKGVTARKLIAFQEILLQMTPSETPKNNNCSRCDRPQSAGNCATYESELLDLRRQNLPVSTEHCLSQTLSQNGYWTLFEPNLAWAKMATAKFARINWTLFEPNLAHV